MEDVLTPSLFAFSFLVAWAAGWLMALSNKGMASKDFFTTSKNEHVKCVQHWMGTGDFFFCHWIAESEDAILDFLIEGGEDQFFHTMCAEMDYYITPNDGNNDIYANISYVD